MDPPAEVDFEQWVQNLSTLLDQIDMEKTASDEVKRLCFSRHAIARSLGVTVEFEGEITSLLQ